jgi:hypothetical protein
LCQFLACSDNPNPAAYVLLNVHGGTITAGRTTSIYSIDFSTTLILFVHNVRKCKLQTDNIYNITIKLKLGGGIDARLSKAVPAALWENVKTAAVQRSLPGY